MADYQCGACGARVTGDSLVCPACGHKAGQSCITCGFVTSRTAFIGEPCPHCGSTAHLPKARAGDWSGLIKAGAFILGVVVVGTIVAFLLGQFRSPDVITGPMVEARSGHTATVIAGDRVLLAGGVGSNGPLASAEIFDATSGKFTATGSMKTARAARRRRHSPTGEC